MNASSKNQDLFIYLRITEIEILLQYTIVGIIYTVESLYYGHPQDNVKCKGLSSFQRLFCTLLYVTGTVDSILIKGGVRPCLRGPY